MRFRRKKGEEQDEVVSGDVVEDPTSTWSRPADALQDDTVDMEAVAPATAAGGAGRSDEVDETAPIAASSDDDVAAERGEAERIAAEDADRKAEEARLADEEAKRAADAEAEARKAEEETRRAEEKAKAEAEASAKAQREAEEAAEAQRKADEKAREKADKRKSAESSSSVSGASVMSPGLGSDASPRAAAAVNAGEGFSKAADDAPAAAPAPEFAVPPSGGALAPILDNPTFQKKPELLVVGGLAAGFVVAKILKAMTSSGDQ